MTELPWFKFNPSLWLSGDISCLSYETQGIFISICSRYWKQGCELDQAKLKRRLSIPSEVFDRVIAELEDEQIIELIDENIFISFLAEQHEELNAAHVKRVAAGSKGGKKRVSNAKAMLKQGSSIKKKDKETDKETDKEIDPEDPFNGKPSLATELTESNLRESFSPFIEYRPAQMGEIFRQLKYIISKSSFERTLKQAEKQALANGGKVWMNSFMSRFMETQCK